jgi:hypothetical protein
MGKKKGLGDFFKNPLRCVEKDLFGTKRENSIFVGNHGLPPAPPLEGSVEIHRNDCGNTSAYLRNGKFGVKGSYQL